ncbi:prepilin peptidase [Modestobacter versicolor]|uniref:Prepilin peptidase n=1 Tax=Modestobacter versicolor TaxID=429133 RepID=A0A323VAP7_9ACTN|nr:A24 family peptidase [Modestobacter versicolor]MBB3676192.1 leader peptidase (prepilin peptidase)/N-methyltransferase [Modestobacter versicolor]PZA21864.1 prepilin peptidase [Modestobacter versicolor]
MSAALVVAAVVLGALLGRVVDSLALVAPRGAAPSGRGVLAGRALGSPWAEVAGAVLTTAVVLRFGWSAELPAWVWFVAVGLLLAVVDLRTMLLPNRVLLPGLLVGLVLLAVAAAVDDRWTALGRAVLAGGAAFAVLLVLALIAPSGMGMGDVKLAGLLGLHLGWLGWPTLVAGLFLGFLVQAVLGLALIALRRAGRKTELPFGPALIAGALAAALLGGSWAVS